MGRRRSGPSAKGLLGRLEYQVMRTLWTSAPANVAAVQARINEARGQDDQLAYTTVMTVLARLHDKGLLDRARRGRGYDYTPRFSEEELVAHLGRREVDHLLERYGGRVVLAQFAAAMEDADPNLIAELRGLLDRVDDA
jgi:predicted transcriptional regulator